MYLADNFEKYMLGTYEGAFFFANRVIVTATLGWGHSLSVNLNWKNVGGVYIF